MKAPGRKVRVLFVGAFRSAAADGTVGGQMVACRALIASGISKYVDWILLDSTQLSLPLPSFAFRMVLALRRILYFMWKVPRSDAVLIFTQVASLSLAEKGLMILIAHGLGKTVVVGLRSEFPSLYTSPWTLRLLKRLLLHCDTVWVQSGSAEARLKHITAPIKPNTLVIPNFLNMGDYSALSKRSENDQDHKEVTFLYAGWFIREKGIWDLIEAFSEVAAGGPPCRLLLCGNGPDYEAIMSRVAERGLSPFVDFRGWVGTEDMKGIFREASALVLPSYSEGMPNSVLEAMAAETPVIATEVGGTPELLKHKETGYLFKPGDVPSLAAYMKKLASSSEIRRSMGRTARAFAVEKFDTERWWPKILEALKPKSRGAGRQQ